MVIYIWEEHESKDSYQKLRDFFARSKEYFIMVSHSQEWSFHILGIKIQPLMDLFII